MPGNQLVFFDLIYPEFRLVQVDIMIVYEVIRRIHSVMCYAVTREKLNSKNKKVSAYQRKPHNKHQQRLPNSGTSSAPKIRHSDTFHEDTNFEDP